MRISRPSFRRSQRAFTMIEIAIAVGVIGFALVAIIGILPRGMNVQKDNREDTIVSQDAPYFLSAIRNGEQRTNNSNLISALTNYVESVTIATTTNNNVWMTNIYTPTNELSYDMTIVGLLSTPEYDIRIPGQTNQVTAVVRAMTGSALQQSGSNILTAFRYQMTVEIDPLNFTATNYSNSYLPDYIGTNPAVFNAYTSNMASGLHEIRLKFAWPVLPNGTVPPGHQQTYRSLIGSHLGLSNGFTPALWFFQPNSYTNNPAGL